MTDRVEQALEFFEQLIITDLGQAIATPDADTYSTLPGIRPRYQWGWLPPLPYTTERLLVTVSPETVAAQCEWLTDDEYRQYLEALRVCIAVHVAHHPGDGFEGLPRDDRDRLAESILFDADPERLALMSAVQVRALEAES